MSPDGTQGIQVYSLDRPNSMIWGTPGDTSWVWQLDARPDGARVITRIRSRIRWQPISIAYSVLMEFGDFWMIRKMLLNLRDRAKDGRRSSAAGSRGGGRRCRPADARHRP
jgi:hypothetical protein